MRPFQIARDKIKAARGFMNFCSRIKPSKPAFSVSIALLPKKFLHDQDPLCGGQAPGRKAKLALLLVVDCS
jgi:hypothetical protein